MFGLEGTRSCARRTTCDEAVAASLPLAMYAGELSRDYLSPLGKRFLQGVPPVTGRSEQSARLAANPRGSARQARRAPKKLARKMVARATGRTRPSYPRAPTAVCSPKMSSSSRCASSAASARRRRHSRDPTLCTASPSGCCGARAAAAPPPPPEERAGFGELHGDRPRRAVRQIGRLLPGAVAAKHDAGFGVARVPLCLA